MEPWHVGGIVNSGYERRRPARPVRGLRDGCPSRQRRRQRADDSVRQLLRAGVLRHLRLCADARLARPLSWFPHAPVRAFVAAFRLMLGGRELAVGACAAERVFLVSVHGQSASGAAGSGDLVAVRRSLGDAVHAAHHLDRPSPARDVSGHGRARAGAVLDPRSLLRRLFHHRQPSGRQDRHPLAHARQRARAVAGADFLQSLSLSCRGDRDAQIPSAGALDLSGYSLLPRRRSGSERRGRAAEHRAVASRWPMGRARLERTLAARAGVKPQGLFFDPSLLTRK